MTKDKLIEHLESVLSCDDGNGGPANIYGIRDAADRIISAIDAEEKAMLCALENIIRSIEVTTSINKGLRLTAEYHNARAAIAKAKGVK